MKFIVGTKQEMTQIFTEEGRVEPATVIKVEPMAVTQIKTADKDGYSAVQFGVGATTEKHVSKPQRTKGLFKGFIEHRTEEELDMGANVSADVFEPGDVVHVSGISKGKGFQGVVKRHGFKGGPRTHGQKHSEREAGSIGSTGPARVFKGVRMAGRMGSDRVTVKNLRVLQVDADNGYILISGAVPGRRGTRVEIVGK